MKTHSKNTKRGEKITETTSNELNAKALLADYIEALKMRQKGTSLLMEGSDNASQSLAALYKYFDRFPAIRATAKAETAERLQDALDWVDADVSPALLDTKDGCAALADHFECQAIC